MFCHYSCRFMGAHRFDLIASDKCSRDITWLTSTDVFQLSPSSGRFADFYDLVDHNY